jgi:hypothetical protein
MEQRNEREARPAQSGKRRYEPPEVLSQEVFETTALACGKTPGKSPACNANKKS